MNTSWNVALSIYRKKHILFFDDKHNAWQNLLFNF